MKYRSRVSIVLVFFILIIGILPFLAFKSEDQSIQFYFIPAMVIGFTIALLSGISYEIKDKQLLVKMFGIKSMTVDVMSITSISRSYNPLSSPASSLKRLLVRSSKTSVLISPVRETEFINQLVKTNPNIKLEVSGQTEWFHFWDWDI